MSTEIFTGNPTALKARLDAIIATPATINQVVRLAASTYLIIYTP
jgi:hypothetical protein